MFDMDFIRRVANALRVKAKEGERYAHLAAHADHMERDAKTNLNRAGRTAMRLAVAWKLDVKLSRQEETKPCETI